MKENAFLALKPGNYFSVPSPFSFGSQTRIQMRVLSREENVDKAKHGVNLVCTSTWKDIAFNHFSMWLDKKTGVLKFENQGFEPITPCATERVGPDDRNFEREAKWVARHFGKAFKRIIYAEKCYGLEGSLTCMPFDTVSFTGTIVESELEHGCARVLLQVSDDMYLYLDCAALHDGNVDSQLVIVEDMAGLTVQEHFHEVNALASMSDLANSHYEWREGENAWRLIAV